MLELPYQPVENVTRGNSPDKYNETILLNKRQWTYVQRRYHLTPRESQIAELICQGLQNGNIAKYLHITPGTVKTHTRNIYRKVRVQSKIAMLLKFVADTKGLSVQLD